MNSIPERHYPFPVNHHAAAGVIIRHARERIGLSRKALAYEMRITYERLMLIETGKAPCRGTCLRYLLLSLDLSDVEVNAIYRHGALA